jgi:hypothetical protein
MSHRSYTSWVTVLWEVHQLEGVGPPFWRMNPSFTAFVVAPWFFLTKTVHCSIHHCFWFDIKGYLYSYILFQHCILLKDNGTFPSVITKIDFLSIGIRTGVSLHGATSKRDSMWHSPVLTCISPNHIPIKRIKWEVVRNFEMQVDFFIMLRILIILHIIRCRPDLHMLPQFTND